MFIGLYRFLKAVSTGSYGFRQSNSINDLFKFEEDRLWYKESQKACDQLTTKFTPPLVNKPLG